MSQYSLKFGGTIPTKIADRSPLLNLSNASSWLAPAVRQPFQVRKLFHFTQIDAARGVVGALRFGAISKYIANPSPSM